MSTTMMPRRGTKMQARRRAELLALRASVGAEWADRMSHGMPSAKLLRELSILEHALTERWPHMSTRWLTDWILADAGRIHGGPEARMPGCRYCASAQR